MQAKKQVKLEDLFTVRFTEKSAIVNKDSDRLWVWGSNDSRYPNNTVFIKRLIKSNESGKLIEREELLPMAIVHNPESIDIEPYRENWILLGYSKASFESAKNSLKRFVEREIKNDGIVYSINSGYIDKLSTVGNLSNKLESAGVSYESGKKYLATVLSPQSSLLGKKFSNYYDLPELEYKALSAASDNAVTTESQSIEVQPTETQPVVPDTDRTMLEAKTKNELIEYATSLNVEVNKKMTKDEIIAAILQAIA